jgi:hypothetical protein
MTGPADVIVTPDGFHSAAANIGIAIFIPPVAEKHVIDPRAALRSEYLRGAYAEIVSLHSFVY